MSLQAGRPQHDLKGSANNHECNPEPPHGEQHIHLQLGNADVVSTALLSTPVMGCAVLL